MKSKVKLNEKVAAVIGVSLVVLLFTVYTIDELGVYFYNFEYDEFDWDGFNELHETEKVQRIADGSYAEP